MKNGTLYAKRVKKFFSKLRSEHGKPEIPEADEPVNRLMIGLLASEASEVRATRAVAVLRETMVDINEIRVSTATEIAEACGGVVAGDVVGTGHIRRALNSIFQKQHAVTLEHLKKAGRREAKHFLESVDGMDSCAVAHVLLWSLGGHAIPVDRRMYELLKREKLVEPTASVDEVQAFLERNVSAADAKLFCLLMHKAGSRKASRGSAGSARKDGKTAKKATRKAGKKPPAKRKPATKSQRKTAAK
jgi:endonuclease III